MAERYEDQQRRERGYRRDERGFMDRAGDEVRSWFGDDEAERRRQLDDRDRNRERVYGQSGEYGPGSYRGSTDRDWNDYTNDRTYGDRGYYGDRSASYSDRASGYGDRGYGGRDYGSRDYMSSGRSGSSYWSGSGSGSGSSSSYRGNAGYGDDYRRVGNFSGQGGYPGSFRDQNGFEAGDRGSFAGRGPKGYQRSDTRINEDVCDRLCDSPEIDATNVEVKVSGGEVTLSGTVSSRDEKRRAEDMIENVSGVREVHNNLRVGRGDEASWSQNTQGSQGATGSTGTAQGTNETPGSTLGLTGQPDRASTAGRR
jgi:osmotically-inducible protein OsmY